MTEEQSEILIAKMLDAPHTLTDSELEMILSDDELKDIYRTSSAVGSACIKQPDIDADKEWQRFLPRIQRKPWTIPWAARAAAIFIGILVLSFTIVYLYSDRASMPSETPLIAADVPAAEEHLPVIEQVPVEPQITDAPKRRQTKAAVSSTARVTEDIDIDEYLRIQQARIDNEFALQAAESYTDELGDMFYLLCELGLYDDSMDYAIDQITMQ